MNVSQNLEPTASLDQCPLCGKENHCELSKPNGCSSLCWCHSQQIPAEILERIPKEARNKVCICRDCVDHSKEDSSSSVDESNGDAQDYYMEGGQLVFTAQYHLKRGYCCKSACRHCPY